MASRKEPDSNKSLLAALKQITGSDAEDYYILWKYAPELLPDEGIKTFEDLTKHYAGLKGRTKKGMEKALLKPAVQRATRYLLKRIDGDRDIKLLNHYYEQAMDGDVQALKAYMDFKKDFFKDDEADELKSILSGVDLKSSSQDDIDFDMDL